MARIRSIKPEFWTSEQVMECSTNARLLFIGLWNFCDDHGRHPMTPRQIKAQVFPGDDFTTENVRGMLDELSATGLISAYVVGDKEYLQVTGWHHQKIDRVQKAKYPGPLAERSANGIDGIQNTEGIGSRRRKKESKNPESENLEVAPEPLPEEPASPPARPSGRGPYAFEAITIRLNAADLARWEQSFPHLSLRSELEGLDEWAGQQGKKWFAAVASALAKREREVIGRLATERQATPHPKTNGHAPTPPKDIDQAKSRLDIGRFHKMWPRDRWGPAPGEEGCLIPAELLTAEDSGWPEWDGTNVNPYGAAS